MSDHPYFTLTDADGRFTLDGVPGGKAEVVVWLSAGALKPTADDVARLRALGLALTPSLAGLIGMLALALLRRG